MCLHFQVKIRHIILSNTFHMNVLSNMLLEGLSARVLQCSQLPPSLAYIHPAASVFICVLPTAFKKLCSDKAGTCLLDKGRLEM